jgi:hypothetical protein
MAEFNKEAQFMEPHLSKSQMKLILTTKLKTIKGLIAKPSDPCYQELFI